MRNTFLIIAFAFCFSWIQAQPASITFTPFASGLNEPVDFTHCGDDRIFVVEKDGLIKILNLSGAVTGTFLNINSSVGSGGSEQGLLGLAFHPDYANNGYFYVNYTDNNGNTKISRFSVQSGNPNAADPASEVVLMTIQQPYSNHNGGCLRFGHDGYLYIGTGDGGSAGDPGNRAQNKLNMLGKMLRIDVNSGTPYGVPLNNPFYGNSAYLPEIWALGLRNPWRFSFDRGTGDMWIGDVGQDAWEEVDHEPVTSHGGMNWGWRCYEGNAAYNTSGCQSASNYDAPVFIYPNSVSSGCAITGGVVYRGAEFPEMYGYYFTSDYCTGRTFWVHIDDQGAVTNGNLGDFDIYDYVCFGEDSYGNVYVTGLSSGDIWKLETSSPGCQPVADIFGGDTLTFCTGATAELWCAQGINYDYTWYFNGSALPDTTPNIIAASSGLYEVIVNNGTCADTSTAIFVEFAPAPTVDIVGLPTTVCDTDAVFSLTGSPAGGGFTGPGVVSGSQFDPGSAGAGTHTLVYTYQDANGCTGVDTQSITVTVCVAGLEIPGRGPSFTLAPNPTQGELFVNFTAVAGEEVKWFITDLAGRHLAEGTWTGNGSHLQNKIEFEGAAGIYLFTLRNSEGAATRRFSVK